MSSLRSVKKISNPSGSIFFLHLAAIKKKCVCLCIINFKFHLYVLLSGQFSSYQAVFYHLQSGYIYPAGSCHSSFNAFYTLHRSVSQSAFQVPWFIHFLSCCLSSAVFIIAGIYSIRKKKRYGCA